MEASYAMSGGAVTPAMLEWLRQTRPWVRFLSIMGFLAALLMVCLGLFMGFAGSMAGMFGDKFGQSFPPAIGIGIAAPGRPGGAGEGPGVPRAGARFQRHSRWFPSWRSRIAAQSKRGGRLG